MRNTVVSFRTVACFPGSATTRHWWILVLGRQDQSERLSVPITPVCQGIPANRAILSARGGFHRNGLGHQVRRPALEAGYIGDFHDAILNARTDSRLAHGRL